MNIMKRALTEIETADYIGMSRSFLRQARMEANQFKANQTSAPPFIKIGRAVRYLREDLDAWLDSFASNDIQLNDLEVA
jgi:predicted DNA-binding transcriptional regulator AlpA